MLSTASMRAVGRRPAAAAAAAARTRAQRWVATEAKAGGGAAASPLAAPGHKPASSNLGSVGAVIVAGAVGLPAAYALYLKQTDAAAYDALVGGFKNAVGMGSKPTPAEKLVSAPPPPPPAPESPKPQATTPAVAPAAETPKPTPPAVATTTPKTENPTDWKAVKKEVDELEQRLRKATSSPTPTPQPTPQPTSQPTPQPTPQTPPPPPAHEQKEEQANVEALRAAAKRVASEASRAAREQVDKSAAQLRADLERVLAHDLSTLDEQGLRERLVQLVLELKDRNRWEAARMHELLSHATEELNNKYAALMREQEAALEALARAQAADASAAATVVAEERFAKALQNRLAKQRDALRVEAEEMVRRARAEEVAARDAERTERVKAVEALRGRVREFEEAIRSREAARVRAVRERGLAAAALKFTESVLLETASGADVEASVSALRVASAGDEVVNAALDALPARAFAGGVDSLGALRAQFPDVMDKCREAALDAKAPGMVSKVVARASTAALSMLGASSSPSSSSSSTATQADAASGGVVSAVSAAVEEKLTKAEQLLACLLYTSDAADD